MGWFFWLAVNTARLIRNLIQLYNQNKQPYKVALIY